MAEKVACDQCREEKEQFPNSLIIRFWGGQEFRLLLCSDCAHRIENLIRLKLI